MDFVLQLNRGWNDIDDFVRRLRLCKRHSTVQKLRTFFLLIPYCRDVIRGKGERDLAYKLIYAFYQVFPVLAIKAVHLLFTPRKESGLPPVGSWCDIKYFCVCIERLSPFGFKDPLIEIIATIANRQLRLDLVSDSISHVSKWIPREAHHPNLFSVFMDDWFSTVRNCDDVIKDNMLVGVGYVSGSGSGCKKKFYRKMVSALSSRIGPGYRSLFTHLRKSGVGVDMGSLGGSLGGFPTMFIGEYVRAVVRGGICDRVAWINEQWIRLLRLFSVEPGLCGLPIVDISMSKECLYHALGFACLIAERMNMKRILLVGSVPIWVDISVCDGFVSMVQLLWSHCEIRGVANFKAAFSMIQHGLDKGCDISVFDFFIFSEQFAFDWNALFMMCNGCVGLNYNVVIWNLGTSFSQLPCDFYSEDGLSYWSDEENIALRKKRIIYISGYAVGLLMPFFSLLSKRCIDNDADSYLFLCSILSSYHDWTLYFDSLVSNHMDSSDLFSVSEERKERYSFFGTD